MDPILCTVYITAYLNEPGGPKVNLLLITQHSNYSLTIIITFTLKYRIKYKAEQTNVSLIPSE